MKLYIDTHEREKIIIGFNEKNFEMAAKKDGSQKLLPFIEEILEKENKSFKDLTEIGVHTGPGSFTGIRVGVAVANSLGYGLNIPVNGKKLEDEINY